MLMAVRILPPENLGDATFLRRIDEQERPYYAFEYVLPSEPGETLSVAGLAFTFPGPTDLTDYNALEVQVGLVDDDNCEVYLKDEAENANYVRLGTDATWPEVVKSSTNDGIKTITMPIDDTFSSVSPRQVIEIGFNVNSTYVQGSCTCRVYAVHLVR
jgi:hypothetical protein